MGVLSIPGQGSIFYFDLKLRKINPEDTVKDDQKELEIKLDPETSFDILIVEDHKMNQLVVEKTLQKKWKNVNILIAENGAEAIQILNKKPVDIILMDILMPVKDGFETTEYIRNKMAPPITNIPILAMTAQVHISQEDRFEKSGLDDYVLKPFDPDQLFAKIEFYLTKIKA